MEDFLLIGLIIFAGSFVNSVAGFGMALVVMPFFISLLGLRTAVPLMALIGFSVMFFLSIRFRRALNFGMVWRLLVASLVALPLGVQILGQVPEETTLPFLGVVIVLYVLYRAFKLPMPALANPNWAFLFGSIGGLLSGAYSTSGPPIVTYADARRWSPDEFRSNLSAYFLVNTIFAITVHYFSGNLSDLVIQSWLLALPFMATGLAAGYYMDRFIDRERFSKIVLALLFIVGWRMAFSWAF